MSTQEEQQERKPSITEFDRQLVEGFEKKYVCDCSLNELLMVLITRGENSQNPVLIGSATTLLRSLNGEFKRRRPNSPRFNNFGSEHGRTHPMTTRSQRKKEEIHDLVVEDTAPKVTSSKKSTRNTRKYND